MSPCPIGKPSIYMKCIQSTYCSPLDQYNAGLTGQRTLVPYQKLWKMRTRSHHFQDGRQGEGDVDLSGDAVIDDWTEGLSVKQCLEGSRVHPMLVKA